MVNRKSDDTLDEILAEDMSAGKKRRKGKGCFIRFLLIITILAVFFFGFLYVQQYLLDLEAEAIIRIYQTQTAAEGFIPVITVESTIEPTSEPTAPAESAAVPTETPEVLTATPDADLARTATIAAQLTSVAEYQFTATSTP
jgi:hypothetical protein